MDRPGPRGKKPVISHATHLSAGSSLFGKASSEELSQENDDTVPALPQSMPELEAEDKDNFIVSPSRSSPRSPRAMGLSSTVGSDSARTVGSRSPPRSSNVRRTSNSPRGLSASISSLNTADFQSPIRRDRLKGFASFRKSIRLTPQSASMTPGTPSSASSRRATLFASRLGRRSTSFHRQASISEEHSDRPLSKSILRKTGDYVLIRSGGNSMLVNKYGFPAGDGETPEEKVGPYLFVLATVKQIHFEEIALYYTVARCDNGMEQRAESNEMESLRTARGQLAALRAASGVPTGTEVGDSADAAVEAKTGCLSFVCFILTLPFFWLYDGLFFLIVELLLPIAKATMLFLKKRADIVLNGREPYVCRMRVTLVNLMVLCSIWLMFMDQARLAFFPPSSDRSIAIVNLVVWLLLLFEVGIEIFIRPNGYHGIIRSDKAFAPTTARVLSCVHLFFELFSLLLFIPEFICLFTNDSCGTRYPMSVHSAVLHTLIGPTKLKTFYGHAMLALVRLRVFGLVRHWRNMWITNTFIHMKWRTKRGIFAMLIPSQGSRTFVDEKSLALINEEEKEEKAKELMLINATNIGTALMVTNSYRALAILWTVAGLFPVINSLSTTSIQSLGQQMTDQLQAVNVIAADTSSETCSFLSESIKSWVHSVSVHSYVETDEYYLASLYIDPPRCGFDSSLEPVTLSICTDQRDESIQETMNMEICDRWFHISDTKSSQLSDRREGSMLTYRVADEGLLETNGTTAAVTYAVDARYDYSLVVRLGALSSLLVQMFMLLYVLGGLSFLRRDAEILVLGPLRKMLKIVSRYAKNPLAAESTGIRRQSKMSMASNTSDESSISDTQDRHSDIDDDDVNDALGSYETERLITAVSRITDLLRKCWGVAGADIISTNLATREGALTEVFNPTVPGKSVYALFAFAAINGFDHALRSLQGDVMVLINDIANVLHGEVYRWGFGDSGQCNKNLGAAFLMVFRIGLVEEVIDKLEQAQDVIFSTKRETPSVRRRVNAASRKLNHLSSSLTNSSSKTMMTRKSDERDSTRAMSLSLQSLPGISTFTDRAVLGMLKSFAGIYRDREILKWNDDFRLSAGVGAFKASLIFGMDAGWAVEGAVGSEYKIDATYLSPHVNMASRMMSACKQYGVNIMLSQSVQELMSEPAKSKLRHLDTVTVKGSSVKQRIYTYDSKAKGVDFFLYGRSDEQADIESERYSPNIWFTDQDLKAMRQHVTDDFLKQFRAGHKAYLAGDWKTAIEKLEQANNTMFETAVEEGYLEDEFDGLEIYAGQDFTRAADDLKRDNGDGPSIYLINYMKSNNGIAPSDWEGWHPLTRK